MNVKSLAASSLGGWLAAQRRRPEALLLLMAVSVPLSFATWQALLNNFAIERAAFSGVEIGILQSLREVPGFLAFTAVFVLLFLREQSFAVLSLVVLGLGTAATGLFPTVLGLYVTTVVMSIGFHYFETLRQSLALQWIDKDRSAAFFGRMMGTASIAAVGTYLAIYGALQFLRLDMVWIYLIGGGATVTLAIVAATAFPRLPQKVEQRKHLVLRARYWLYYALVFMAGARRQIFIVFAGFLMVEKFHFGAAAITLMFLANESVNIFAAPIVGKLIGRWGERRALTFEYIGLAGIFVGYAFVEDPWLAVGLYMLDAMFFAMAIAIKTYFQKIADPADIASTSGVSFTINHIVAVIIPAAFGLLWMVSPSAVFLAGAGLTVLSLGLARLVPLRPSPDQVSVLDRLPRPVAAE